MTETQTLIATAAALALPVLLFALLGGLIWRSMRGGAAALKLKKAELAERLARARPGSALVVSSEAGLYECRDQHGFGMYREVSLTLEVRGEGAPYAATGKWEVQLTALPKVAPDATVSVLIDSTQPRIVYPKESWARAAPPA